MTYIILEASLNHNGSIITAKEMAKAAKEVGADCIKFQYYDSLDLAHPLIDKKLFDRFRACELSLAEHEELASYCRDEVGIEYLCTPEGVKEVVDLAHLVSAYKISSVGAANPHILRAANHFKKPVYLSTGVLSVRGVNLALELLSDCKVTLLDCVSKYPARVKEYPNKYEGLSDHTLSLDTPYDRHYTVIEKHFTLNRSVRGFDHRMSLNPMMMKEYIRRIRERGQP